MSTGFLKIFLRQLKDDIYHFQLVPILQKENKIKVKQFFIDVIYQYIFIEKIKLY